MTTPAQQFTDMLTGAIDWGRVDEIDETVAMQAGINAGTVWKLEGSIGRAAMNMIEAGKCMVGQEPRFDYWGNQIPARDMLQPGSLGTPDYVAEHMGQAWLDILLDADEQWEEE
jgi:hypothetical protein